MRTSLKSGTLVTIITQKREGNKVIKINPQVSIKYKTPKHALPILDGPVDPTKAYGKPKKGLKTAKKALKKPSKGTSRGVK